jgi:hypothetical protein
MPTKFRLTTVAEWPIDEAMKNRDGMNAIFIGLNESNSKMLPMRSIINHQK